MKIELYIANSGKKRLNIRDQDKQKQPTSDNI